MGVGEQEVSFIHLYNQVPQRVAGTLGIQEHRASPVVQALK